MTPRQTSYLSSLIAEREQSLVQLALNEGRTADGAKATFLLAWNRETEGGTRPSRTRGLTVPQASEAITWVLGVNPDQPREAAPAADVPQGRYAIVADDGTVKFYKVDRPTEGRWSGYTFVKVQASDEWHRVPRPAQPAILAAIAADPVGAMRRYGLELGRCGNCGRTLTDETSRAMGIGPDCAHMLGLDRSPYAEAARQQRVERIHEIHDEDDEIEAEGAVIVAEERAAMLDHDDREAEGD